METVTYIIVFPDGDEQEIDHGLRVNQYVDLNGNPLSVPLRTTRAIVYRVFKMTTRSGIGLRDIRFYLDLVRRPELQQLVEEGGR